MKAKRQAIEATGTRVAFVHMGTEEQAKDFFERWGDDDVARFSDPEARLYHSFGLKRGSLGQLFNLTVLTRGFDAAILKGFGGGKMIGDAFQMPGVFLIHQGKIVKEFRHETQADRPDYEALAVCELG